MALEQKKADTARELAELEQQLAQKQRLLDKLNKVQDLKEPGVGSAIQFSRTLAGSTQVYTFVAARIGLRWYITGTDNSLRLLGLTNKGNNWDDILVAIGDAQVRVTKNWEPLGRPEYEYFQGYMSSKIFRTSRQEPSVVEVKYGTSGEWNRNSLMNRKFLLDNPGSYRVLDKELAGE